MIGTTPLRRSPRGRDAGRPLRGRSRHLSRQAFQRELNHADSQSVNTLLHTISDFERISDHSVNLMESAEEMHTKDIQFSQDARDELQVLEDAVQDILNRTTDAFRKGDLHLASKVEPLEAVVNELVRAIKATTLPACRPAAAPLNMALCWTTC